MEKIEGISTHKVGRYGEQIVFDALNGAEWPSGGFNTGEKYDLEWEGIKISVSSSTIMRRTGFVFSNPRRYKKDLLNVFVGVDGDNTYFWVRKGIDKTGFYGAVSKAITSVDDLGKEIKLKGGE